MTNRIKQIRKDHSLTQLNFAKKLGLSQNYIAQLESGSKTPSDRTISDICREFNVNEAWLRSGIGQPYLQRSVNDEISDMLSDIQIDDSSFKHRLISALANLDNDGWNMLENLIDDITYKPGDD